MSDINKVIIRGRAAANADWKDLPNTTLVTLRVATSDDYTDRDGRKVWYRDWETDRKSTRLNSSHSAKSRMPSSA